MGTIRRGLTVLAGMLLLVVASSFPVAAGPPDSAVMEFGRDLGSGCNPPECFDDASFHADDKIVPGAVVISAGGEVTFNINGFHQVAIYEPGTKPADIDTGILLFDFFIDDPNGRVELGLPAFAGPRAETFTFDEPGKYLVICTVLPHFEEAQMWGWVIVN